MAGSSDIHDRIYYLDWLRVIAVLLLIPFHTGMIFSDWDFHIKNKVTSTDLTIINAFIDNWHMPLFFLLSGASTWFALKKRNTVAYIKERFLRLVIPLIFGMIVIVPPQTYFERIQKSGFSGSYLDFYGHLFNGIYPKGNVTWNHLWFLPYLFIISLVVLPFVVGWASHYGAPLMETICVWPTKGRRIFSLGIPLVIIQMALKVAFPGPQNIVSDWARLLFMLVVFLYGIMLFMYPAYRDCLVRNRATACAMGLCVLAFFIILNGFNYRFVFGYNVPNLLQLGIKSFATWCWLIAILGFAQEKLNISHRFLDYAREAVLPFYILHQTVVIVVGFYIVETDFPLMVKYTGIIVMSFIFTLAIYETIIRRFAILHILFGMRLMAKEYPRKPSLKH